MSRPAAFALLLFVAFPAIAVDPPALTNYQGVLRDAADAPLTGDFDMVFRFFDAESAGNEILIDRHFASNAQAVTADGGLFSVALGGGQVVDGSGPGTFTSLADLFRDHAGVWLEVTIGAETLAPRTRIQSAPYAIDANWYAGSPENCGRGRDGQARDHERQIEIDQRTVRHGVSASQLAATYGAGSTEDFLEKEPMS